jgi:hypothetical protein
MVDVVKPGGVSAEKTGVCVAGHPWSRITRTGWNWGGVQLLQSPGAEFPSQLVFLWCCITSWVHSPNHFTGPSNPSQVHIRMFLLFQFAVFLTPSLLLPLTCL